MTTEGKNNLRRVARIIVLLAAMTVWCWWLPPFHVISLRKVRQEEKRTEFDGNTFARNFWDKKLMPAAATATDAAKLFAALNQDYPAAQKRFGHSLGLSTTTSFFIRGTGRITAVESDIVHVKLDGTTNAPAIELPTGLIFGNVVRDATGLINPSDFPNSQNFNAIATGLNHIVETNVLPALRTRARVGKAIHFIGCVELDEDSKTDPWTVVPVKIGWP